MGRIGANISGLELKLLNRLAQSNAAVTLSSLRLASGARIGSPRENPAGFVNLSGLQSGLSSVQAALANTAAASGVVSQAQLVLDQIRTQLGAIRTKALADEDQELTDDERAANQAAIDAAIATIDSLASSEIGGRRLLDGSADFLVAGANAAQVASLEVFSRGDADVQTIAGQVTLAATQAQLIYTGAAGNVQSDATFTLTGDRGVVEVEVNGGESLADAAERINQESHRTGILASVNGDALRLTSIAYGSAAQVAVAVTDGSFAVFGGVGGMDAGSDAVATINGRTYAGEGNRFLVNTNRFSFAIAFDPQFTGALDPISVSGDALTFALTSDLRRTASLALPNLGSARLGGLSGNLSQLASGASAAGLGDNASLAVRIVDEALGQLTRLDGRVDGFADEVIAASSGAMTGAKTNFEKAIDSVNRVNEDEELLLRSKNQALSANALAALAVLDAQRSSMVEIIRKLAGLD